MRFSKWFSQEFKYEEISVKNVEGNSMAPLPTPVLHGIVASVSPILTECIFHRWLSSGQFFYWHIPGIPKKFLLSKVIKSEPTIIILLFLNPNTFDGNVNLITYWNRVYDWLTHFIINLFLRMLRNVIFEARLFFSPKFGNLHQRGIKGKKLSFVYVRDVTDFELEYKRRS